MNIGPWQPLDPIRSSSVIVARPSLIVKNQRDEDSNSSDSISKSSSSSADNFNKKEEDFFYNESKSDEKRLSSKIEEMKDTKRRCFVKDLDSSGMAGDNFDPKERCFDIEELRPQPIIRKRKKTHVPEHEKDEQYWEKRSKNTEATRKAREAKRVKETQIFLRVAFLETENERLTEKLERVKKERDSLKQKVAVHETSPEFNSLSSADVANTLYVDSCFTQNDYVEVSTCGATTDESVYEFVNNL